MGIRLKDLSKLGYRDNVARSLAVAIVGKHCKHQSKEQIIKTLSDVLENPDTYKENEGEEFSVSRLAYQLDGIEKNQKITDAKKKFVSFQKSLEFTVARIPAQTMQSFMKMKAVAFNDSDKNVVHVSHWQTWLQGSDYRLNLPFRLAPL